MLFNLRMEHEKLKAENKKCGGSETAQAYDGVRHARNSTLQQIANISIRLPIPVINEMGNIMNEDHPEIILASKKSMTSSKVCTQSEEELLETEDCRRYRSFINISILKSSSAFMNASGENSEQIQISTLRRIKDLYTVSNFKAVQKQDLSQQFKYTQLAYKEKAKFLRFIESDKWPQEMEGLLHNMLETVILDKDLEENSCNELEILPRLLESFKRHFPDFAALKMAKWKASVEEVTVPQESSKVEQKSSQQNLSSPEKTSKMPSSASEENLEVDQKPEEEGDNVLNEPNTNEKDILEDKGIRALNFHWKQYMTDELNEQQQKFDLLLTSPPSAPSRSYIKSMKPSSTIEEIEPSDMKEFCSFMRRVLKNGSYVVLLIHFTMFQEWYEVLDSNGFMIMPNELIITYDPETVKKRKIGHFSQAGHDVALIAKVLGAHPSGFMLSLIHI